MKHRASLKKLDFALMISFTLIIVGLLEALLFYSIYIAGRPEGLRESRSGLHYVTKIEAGDKDYKSMALIGIKTAFLGFVSSAIFFSIKQVTNKDKKI